MEWEVQAPQPVLTVLEVLVRLAPLVLEAECAVELVVLQLLPQALILGQALLAGVAVVQQAGAQPPVPAQAVKAW